MKIEIEKDELTRLQQNDDFLIRLHKHGVENWEGYDAVLEEMTANDLAYEIYEECGDAGHR